MLLTIITAVIVFSVLIILHEMGHFILAKNNGIRVEEFSIGLGHKILGVKKGDTTYKISTVPFGGYVKLAGFDPKERLGFPYEFYSKPHIIRAKVVAAGPIFNLMLSISVFFIVYSLFGISVLPVKKIKSAPSYSGLQRSDEIIKINDEPVNYWNNIIEKIRVDSVKCLIKRRGKEQEITIIKGDSFYIEPLIYPVIIGRVGKNTPAYKTGIRAGDIIVKINHKKITDWDTLVSIIRNNPGKELLIGWLSGSVYKEKIIIPKKAQIYEGGKLKSIGIIGVEMKMERKRVNPLIAIKLSFLHTIDVIIVIFSVIKKLIIKEVSTQVLGGPVAIIKFAHESASWGIENVLLLIGVLSINLFIFNLIPFPPLDGGQLLLILIEKIKRSPISENTIRLIQNIGVSLLILLAIYVTFNDIIRILK